MAVSKSDIGLLRMTEMAVGLIVEIGIIRFQIQIIKFLDHRMRRRRGVLKRVNLRGIGKECCVRRTGNCAGLDGILVLRGEDK